MSCKAYREMLHSYASNELNEIDHAAISEHLKSCAACSNELKEINSLKQVFSSLKSKGFQLDEIKCNIMSAIKKNKKKTAAYDIKVLTKLGASMIACGIISMILNFTSLGDGLIQHTGCISTGFKSNVGKLEQPMENFGKGLINMSDRIVSLDGIMFRIGQKIKGGM